jgi:hypothetical protein
LLILVVAAWLSWPTWRQWLATDGPGRDGSTADAAVVDAGTTNDAKATTPERDGGASSDEQGESDAQATPDAPPPGDKKTVAITKPPDRKPRFGYLNINSRPWAFVEIDGKKLPKETPLFGIKVKAGKHRLRFFNPELKIEKTVPVTVRHQQTQTVSVVLDNN